MLLLQLDKVNISFGANALLDNANLSINTRERVCLIGRNGAGKSTLMKLISNKILPDSGHIRRQKDLVVSVLEQDIQGHDSQSVYSVIAEGLGETGKILDKWYQLSSSIFSAEDMSELEKLQEQIEHNDGWNFHYRIQKTLEQFKLDGSKKLGLLSGGLKRRVELARALICKPDLLLLDEPTNHMDIIIIDSMEKQLKSFSGAILFITHDRSFLKSVATRIVELDRGQLISWNCTYDEYLEKKVHLAEVEERQNENFNKKLSAEEAWIRKGIKARRTRNEGRVRALQALRQVSLERRKQIGKASLAVETRDTSGKLVAELTGITHQYNDNKIINNFNFTLLRGDKTGFIGMNGVGKSTLLKIIIGDIHPTKGKVIKGTRIKTAYFEQMRKHLDPEMTVFDSVAEGRDTITINDKSQHVMGYLQNFLFSASQVRSPIKALSGGECNRLLLAHLFSKPVNLLIMDEPTNDLDVETLELLESLLVDFKGTLLLVSHDREFLDNVVSNVLVFKSGNKIEEFVGGYTDWLRQGGALEQLAKADELEKPKVSKKETIKLDNSENIYNAKKDEKTKKLSYKLQRELDYLPKEIENIEKQIKELEAAIAQPDFYQQNNSEIQANLDELNSLNKKLEAKMNRWLELEN